MDKALGILLNRALKMSPAEKFAFDREIRNRSDSLPSSKIELSLSKGRSRGIFRIFLENFNYRKH